MPFSRLAPSITEIKALVWDLDDTLLDTTNLLIPLATVDFQKRIQEKLPLLPGALQNLQILNQRYSQYLLSYGDTAVQNTKIKNLGIQGFFKKIFIADRARKESKADYFRILPLRCGYAPYEMLSIGNRLATDIGEAKRAGLCTCLFHYGEHATENPQGPHEVPDFRVTHHPEIIPICGL
jgi:putative hydrolase of the HAD superfamily